MTILSPAAQLPGATDHMIVMADLPRLSPPTAFDYFTRPELLAQWWPPEAIVEPRAGGSYRLSWPEMGWELFGRYSVFEPGERLGFSWRWSHHPELPLRVVEVVFAPSERGCRVTVTHGVYGDSAVEQDDRQSHIDGWLHFLGRLQAITV